MILPRVQRVIAAFVVVSHVSLAFAAVPPPDKLLPGSTLGLATIPDVSKARSHAGLNPTLALISDPAMRPIMDKFKAKFQTEIVAKLEQQFGIQWTNYQDLAQGQITLAWLAKAPDAKPGDPAPFVFLIDSGSKSNQLKKSLEDMRKKWVDSGRQIKMDKIRGVDFSTLIFHDADLKLTMSALFPGGAKDEDGGGKAKAEKPEKEASNDPATRHEWLLGQSDSLLLLGNSAASLEKVLALQGGGSGETLADSPNFAAWRDSVFRPADFYLYGNVQEIVAMLKKELANSPEQNRRRGAGPAGSPLQWIDGFGVGAIRSVSYAGRVTPEGSFGDFKLTVPEGERAGLVKMFVFDPKDSAPPDFVPEDVLKFSRSRADLQRAVQVLEETLNKVIPQSASLIKMVMDTAGKDKDPDFDLRKNLLGNLGDDLISYARSPKERTLEAMSAPPSLTLIGSRNPEKLMIAVKTVSSMVSAQAGRKERDFLGHKVLTLAMPDGQESVSLTTHGGYLVISQEPALLEDYLRSAEQKAKPLKGVAGLVEDAQKIRGLGTGLFSYVNDLETGRFQFEVLKKESGSLANLVAGLPIASTFGWDEDAKAFKGWLDFTLLPPFDQVSKYFHRSVYTGEFTPQGFEMRLFSPMPPGMRK